MENRLQQVTWTSTMGTDNEFNFIDKIIKYGDIHYQCFPLNHPGEITKRSADFVYRSVETRILRDKHVYLAELEECNIILSSQPTKDISDHQVDDVEPFWDNSFFNGDDARYGYAMMARHRPGRVIEIGAGNSTKFFRRSARDFGFDVKLIAIDPAPRADIAKVVDQVIQKSVFGVDLDLFDQLKEGDFLSWDGSHVVSNGSDVTRLFLEVLPRLKRGVIVHIHDITMPFEAAFNGVVGAVSFPENYMLGNYLINNSSTSVLLPVHFLHRTGLLERWGGSFWLRL